MKKSIFHHLSLFSILTTVFTVSGILVAVSITTVLYTNFKNGLYDELRNRLVSITTVASLQQDGDTLLKIQARDDEYYNIINERNLKIRLSDPDLVFVYTMRKNDDGIYFVVDANMPGDEDIADFGQPYEEPGPTLADNFDTIDRTIIEPDLYTDEFGTFLSAYAPIYNSSGERVGVLGVDITANNIIAKQRRFLIQSLLILLASIPLIVFLGTLLGRLLSVPLTGLTESVSKIAEGNLKERATISANSKEVALLSSSFNSMAEKLEALVNNLERQVAERTEKLENRAAQLQAISNIARTIASLQDIDKLLPEITKTISQQFGFYHVGIFMLDENREYAVLQATNSEGGQRMLSRQYKLKLSEHSIVGYSISRGEPRVALNVGDDIVFHKNPDLPDTLSEMALPLRVGRRIIGALDVQSTQPDAFNQDDIALLTTLADQVAIVIENSRTFSESRDALQSSEETLARYVKQEWSNFAGQVRHTGYYFDGKQSAPLERKRGVATPLPILPQTGSLSSSQETGRLTIPIKFRGQVIGILGINPRNKDRKWTTDDLALLEAAVERTALALENARLVEGAQRRASRERTIGEISTKIGTFSELETIIQAAVEELGRRIGGGAEVTLELENKDEKS